MAAQSARSSRRRRPGASACERRRPIHRLLALSALLLGLGGRLAAQSTYTPYDFTTLAGAHGSQDGPTSSVRLYMPYGVAVDGSGNLYVSDYFSGSIEKITPQGAVTTLAGGSHGSGGGNGGGAQLNAPMGVALDAGGNLYVSDTGSSTIKKITPGGAVSTLAGNADKPGSTDGAGSEARFSLPEGVAVDSGGNVYVADEGNSTIRKITPDGVVTTLAGAADATGSDDGTGAAATFEAPFGVAVDAAGNVYVADQRANTIRKITPGGVVTTLAGTPGTSGRVDGTGPAAQFNDPRGIAVDAAGNLYVADSDTVRLITPGGMVTTIAGRNYGSADGTGPAAQFYYPSGLAVDASGKIFVADQGNWLIRKVSAGGVVSTVAGVGTGVGSADGTGDSARFNFPYGVAVDGSGTVYVADSNNCTIRAISREGVVSTLAGSPGISASVDGAGAAARFEGPEGVAVDGAGNVYVADYDTIRTITPKGIVSTLAGLAGAHGSADGIGAAARFYGAVGVAVDGAGNVYVADSNNETIRKITPDGAVTTLAGHAGVLGSSDGAGAAAGFRTPAGVAVDSAGNIYVADQANETIRKITAAGAVTTLVGAAGADGSADGTGGAARFAGPVGVAVDGMGNVYVTDTENRTVRKVTPSGAVTTLAGSVGDEGNADGVGAAAIFNLPLGIAVDVSGNLFVADGPNNTIRVGSPGNAPLLPSEPSFSSPAVSQAIATGDAVVFGAPSNSVPAPGYQWSFNGVPIAGATGSTLLIAGATAANSGEYYCVATNPLGITTTAATLAVVDTPDPGRLINLSCRSPVGTGSSVLIAGFVVGGNGTSGSETLLVRASGPALAPFGVTGELPDPDLQVNNARTISVVATNTGWGGSALVSSTAAAVVAFPWIDPTSHDSALVESLPAGPYTAVVTGNSGDTGIALAEIYDATPAGMALPATPHLINISARTQVGQGADVLIAGFVIGGATSKTVLIRASGPALVPFGVSGTLSDPQLQLDNAGRAIAANNGWGGDPQIAAAAASVGAFSWGSSATLDSAILITLPPGAYTAQVSGASGDSGIALVEVYDVQ